MGGLVELIIFVVMGVALWRVLWERRSAEAEVTRATADWIEYLLSECPELTR
jgi:hypothetical protein